METSEKIIQKLLDFHNLKNGVPEIIREAEKKLGIIKTMGIVRDLMFWQSSIYSNEELSDYKFFNKEKFFLNKQVYDKTFYTQFLELSPEIRKIFKVDGNDIILNDSLLEEEKITFRKLISKQLILPFHP